MENFPTPLVCLRPKLLHPLGRPISNQPPHVIILTWLPIKFQLWIFCVFLLIDILSAPPHKKKLKTFFWGTTIEIKPHSFFVLSLPSYLVLSLSLSLYIYIYIYCRLIWKNYVNFLYIYFIFVMVKDSYWLTAPCIWTNEIKTKTKPSKVTFKLTTHSIVQFSPQTMQWYY